MRALLLLLVACGSGPKDSGTTGPDGAFPSDSSASGIAAYIAAGVGMQAYRQRICTGYPRKCRVAGWWLGRMGFHPRNIMSNNKETHTTETAPEHTPEPSETNGGATAKSKPAGGHDPDRNGSR